jgi:hypothetical protein
MAGGSNGATDDQVIEFGHKLSVWAETLDERLQAMLIDLMAKAGGDVYGHDMANDAASPDGKESDSSNLSPLELGDYVNAVQGIFKAKQESHAALNQQVREAAGNRAR